MAEKWLARGYDGSPVAAAAPRAPLYAVRRAPHVEPARPESAAEWDAFVERQQAATLYHLYAWRAVAERAYRLPAPFLCARDAPGRPIRGVLPLFRLPRPSSPYLTNGLFGAYGGVLADDDRCAQALVSAAMQRVDEGQADFLHLKLLGPAPAHLPLERHDIWVTALLDLEDTPDAEWQRLPKKMRWYVRHAQRAGLACARGPAELPGFYDVLSENMLRKGSPIYGRRFFEELAGALGPRASVITLKLGGRVVSGAFVTWFHGVLYVPFASSRPGVFRSHPNHLLYWEILRLAHDLGLRTLDFGTSLRGSSGLAFKLHWRPRVVPIGSYLYADVAARPVLAVKDSAIARTIVRGWSRLPACLAETLGPAVCRWIA